MVTVVPGRELGPAAGTGTGLGEVVEEPRPPPTRDKEGMVTYPILLSISPDRVARNVGKKRSTGVKRHSSGMRDSEDPAVLAAAMRDAGVYGLVGAGGDAGTRSRVKQQARLVQRTLRALYPGRSFPEGTIRRLIWEAHASTDDNSGEAEALRWAGGFQFPADVASRDSNGLRMAHGNLGEFCRARHAEMAAQGRLSRESIAAHIDPTDPDFATLQSLVDGITIDTPDGFIPNGPEAAAGRSPLPPLRQKYLRW